MAPISLYFERKKMVKVYQYGYQMKGLDLRVKNLLLVDWFCCFLMRNWSQRTPMLQDFLIDMPRPFKLPDFLEVGKVDR